MHERPQVLILSAVQPDPAVLSATVGELCDARLAVVTQGPLSSWPTDLSSAAVYAVGPAAQAHGPAFRRTLRGLRLPQRFAHHVINDDRVGEWARHARVVLPLQAQARGAAERLVERYPDLALAEGPASVKATLAVRRRRPRGRRRRHGAAPQSLLPARLRPERARLERARNEALELLRSGRNEEAEAAARKSLQTLRTPRLRADLLGDVVSWALAHGRRPSLAIDAYAAELAVADAHLAAGEHEESAASFLEAMRTAWHPVLHFDSEASPLSTDPAAYTAPLRTSSVARALRGGDLEGRSRDTREGGKSDRQDRRTRLFIATQHNADFLGEIREHFGAHPDFETRFEMFPDAEPVVRYAKRPLALARQVLTGADGMNQSLEQTLGAQLDWADVTFVEWSTALAAMLSHLRRGDTRLVVRLHSYEVFTQWPHLTDFSAVDDVVFVSEHLRDLAVAAIPGLQGAMAPRLHVLANAMELQRFVRPKPSAARFTLAVVGASKMVKDPRWAIEVLRHLRLHDDRYRLVLVRGRLQQETEAARRYAEAMEEEAVDLEEQGALTRLSHTDDVAGVLEEVGVVLSSSLRESFHMGLVEGVASGALPVVRDWPFFPGAAKRLFPNEWVADSPEAAAERILSVNSHEETWRETAEAAQRLVLARWDWSVVAPEYERLFMYRT